jgi:transcriptional regulator with XRE-family HTH domain
VSRTAWSAALLARGSRVQVARALGCHPSLVSRLVSGERAPSLAMLARAADRLGIDPSLFVTPVTKDESDTSTMRITFVASSGLAKVLRDLARASGVTPSELLPELVADGIEARLHEGVK